MFEVIPAVDILNSKCVRLKQGRYDKETIYDNDPVAMAKRWQDEGANRLHIIDLDGARTGIPKNIQVIEAICKELKIPIQVGGGIRNMDTIKRLLDFGIDRVILGTTAVKNPNTLAAMCSKFGSHIVVSIDAKDNMATSEGWTKVSKKDIKTLAQEAVELGVKRFVYTDISRDGMLTGPNLEGIKSFISYVNVPVIASGGVTKKEDVENIRTTGAEACIVGKALYEGKIKLADLLEI